MADLETLHLLFRVQECRFITPSQEGGMQVYNYAGIIVLSTGDGILTHLT
jgi:hypothetical protein